MPSSCESRVGGPKSEDKGSPKAPEPQEATQPVDPEDLHTTQPQSLGLLPAELILVALEFFSGPDAVCLALTCRDICKISNIRKLVRHLDKRATRTLLCRLEGDLPGLIYCFVETKLVRFRTSESGRACVHHHSFRRTRFLPLVDFGGIIEIPYFYARLATIYRILGPQHGILTSHLEETWDHLRRDLGVCWKEDLAAKVVNGELFVFFRHTFSHERGDADALECYIRTRDIVICSHKPLYGQSHNIRSPLGPINATGNPEYHYKGSCGKCETDWETSIACTDPERGWTVTLRTYRGLGSCRSPNDRKWKAMTRRSRSSWYRELPSGGVKALWRA